MIKNDKKKAFSLVEMLIVVALVSILAASALPIYSNFYGRAQLNETSLGIIQTLRQARESSFVRYNNSNYGVKFLTNSYVLYVGTSYASRTTSSDLTYPLDKSLSLTTTLNNDEVEFSKGLGNPNTTGTITLNNTTLGNKSIVVKSGGLIDTDSRTWKYRRAITINRAYVPGTLTNFPVLISVSGLSNVNADGSDIIFTAADGVTQLPREIESYNNGTLTAWVKMNLTKTSSDTSNDVVYMYYGNPSTLEPSANSTYGSQQVWSNGYKAIWHLDNVSKLQDSTGAHNGTAYGNPTNDSSGIGGSIAFGGAGDYINTGVFGANTVDFGNSDFTASFWVKAKSTSTGALASKGTDDTNWSWDKKQFFFSNTAVAGNGVRPTLVGYADDWINTVSTITPGAWNLVTFSRIESSNTNYIYINGTAVAITGAFNLRSNSDDPTWYFFLGRRISTDVTPNEDFYGSMDEVHLSNVTRSGNWISTEYNNQSAPGTFSTLGSEELVSRSF